MPEETAAPPAVELTEILGKDFPAEVLHATLPVVLYCYRPGTPPAAEEAVKEVVARFRGKLKGVRLNCGADPRTAAQLGILATPSIMLFVPGIQGTYTRQSWSPPGVPPNMTDWNTSIAERFVGPLSADRLESKIRPHVP